MTTQINVIVDDGGLSAKAMRQTQSNRWQKLEQDNRQKVEAKGIQQRDAERAQQGIGPDGRPLYGTPPAQPLRRDEPAAFRSPRKVAGTSIGWLFSRIKEQPLFWEYATSTVAPCGGTTNYGRTTTKQLGAYKLRSGDGSAEVIFDTGYDISGYFSRGGDGTDLGGSAGAPSTFPLGATNSGGDRSKQTGWQVWLPVAPGVMLFAIRYRRIDAVQLITQRNFVPDCSNPANVLRNFYALTPVSVAEATVERCYLISQSAIKELSMPSQFRNKLETTQRQWSVTASTREVAGGSGGYYEGVSGSAVVDAFAWTSTAPTASLTTLLSGRSRRYTVTSPLPNSFSQGSYVLATGGIYETLNSDSSTDYDGFALKAPAITNVNDSTGFGAGVTWPDIYTNATTLLHTGVFASDKVNAKKLAMSGSRIAAPSDALTYTDQSGITQISTWSATVGIGYDWLDPGYCRQQLSLLGFTEADLTP